MREIITEYSSVRDIILPGDLIAFSGTGIISSIIKWATNSIISHVGVVIKTEVVGGSSGRVFYNIIEATSLDGFTGGVVSTRISDRIRNYEGDVWCFRIRQDLRKGFDETAFFNFMFNNKGRGYDYIGAIRSGKNILQKIGISNPEDYNNLFCSELVAGGYKAGGLFNNAVNPSTINPQVLCEAALFEPELYHLKGSNPGMSNRFNTNTSFLKNSD